MLGLGKCLRLAIAAELAAAQGDREGALQAADSCLALAEKYGQVRYEVRGKLARAIALGVEQGGQIPGVGNSQHLLGELINKRTGAKLVHVPYKGFAPVIAAVMGGEIQLAFASALTVVPHIKGGRLRAVAMSGSARWQGLPDVPTFTELGYTDFEVDAKYGLVALMDRYAE